MSSFRKSVNSVVGISILLGMSYCTYNFASAESRVHALCEQMKPGMTIEELREFVATQGMSPAPEDSGISFVVETKTYGRFGCKVVTEAGFVKEATYNFAD